jgi:hypothetical protein
VKVFPDIVSVQRADIPVHAHAHPRCFAAL